MNIFRQLFRGIFHSSARSDQDNSVSRKKLPDGIDWHCHILPGVDDGFQELDKSLKMLATYEERGLEEVWFTPHIMEDVPNSTSHLREVFATLENAYQQDFKRRNPADNKKMLKLHLASENMLDALFEERLNKNDLLPLGNEGAHLLVETSIFFAPMDYRSLLERIRNKGYTPVLAHPERYLYMRKSDYEVLRAQGIKFQLNLFSLKGQYGDKVKKRAKWLQARGMYDFVGTDLHRPGVFQRYW